MTTPDPRFDKIGQEINIDDAVAVVKSHQLIVGKIVRFTPKIVKLVQLDSNGNWRIRSEFASYASDMVLVDQQAVMLYLLKHGSPK